MAFCSFPLKGVLGRSKRKWDDNIETSLKVTVFQDVDWIHVAQDWVLYTVHGNEPSRSLKRRGIC
jgi:hypothetical protein